jgi:hypothetical protein
MDLDDLRRLTDDDDDASSFSFADMASDDFEGMAIDDGSNEVASGPKQPFLGMSARERMFLAIMFFFNVLILGIGLLLATGRLG